MEKYISLGLSDRITCNSFLHLLELQAILAYENQITYNSIEESSIFNILNNSVRGNWKFPISSGLRPVGEPQWVGILARGRAPKWSLNIRALRLNCTQFNRRTVAFSRKA
nr:hypothetical protein [Trentepohlia sp. YN1317]